MKIKINQKPRFFPPKDPHLPARFTMAAIQSGKNLIFGHDCLKALWANEADISDLKFLKDLKHFSVKKIVGFACFLQKREFVFNLSVL